MDKKLGLDSVDKQESESQSALYLAVECGMVENVDMLLKTNTNLVTQTFQGNTPLHLAASLGHTDIMAALMKKMADVNVRNHTMAVATIIHSNHGCDIDARNLREETPLHCAVDKGNIGVVELLLVAGANLRITQKSGKSALELACRNAFVTIIDQIIKSDRFRELQRMGHIEPCVEFSIGYWDIDCDHFTQILSDLTHKYLAQHEWKQLAEHWGFYEYHLSAIEQEFEGPNSWKEHGHRMCLIWLHGLNEEEDYSMKCLNEVLIKLGKEKIAKKLQNMISRQTTKSVSTGRCVLS